MLRFLTSSLRPNLFRTAAATRTSATTTSTSNIIPIRSFATTTTPPKSTRKRSSSTAESKEVARALAAQKRAAKRERAQQAAEKRLELRQKVKARTLARRAKEAQARERFRERRAALKQRRLATIAKARAKREQMKAEKKVQPKKPGSSYSLFVKQRAPAIFQQTKNLPEAGRRLAAEWRALTPAQKKPFQDQLDALRAQYAAEQAAQPKRPLSTYIAFCQKERANLPRPKNLEESQQQIKQLADKWRQLTPQEKARYAPSPSAIAQYARAKEQHQAKVQQYIQQHHH